MLLKILAVVNGHINVGLEVSIKRYFCVNCFVHFDFASWFRFYMGFLFAVLIFLLDGRGRRYF